MASCSRHPVGRWWKHFVIILTPLVLLLPLLLVPEEKLPAKANQCLYVMLLMAVYWCTEVMSLAITACIPIFVFPMLGILTTQAVCAQYLTSVVMMFVGGIMMALAVEKCNLHKRIAVGILHLLGTKPLWLMLGFMLPTCVLSMWICNTATTTMILPISEAVLDSLKKTDVNDDVEDIVQTGVSKKESALASDEETGGISNNCIDMSLIVMNGNIVKHSDVLIDGSRDTAYGHTENEKSDEDLSVAVPNIRTDATLDNFAKGMTIAVAYAANVGGAATLIGALPNAIMKGQADIIWRSNGYAESTITFSSWCIIGIPVAIINLTIMWLWLTVLFNGIRSLGPCCVKLSKSDVATRRVIEQEYKTLGRISFAEVIVSLMFLLMVLLWFFRSPSFMTGWGDLDLKPGYAHDAVVSIFIGVVLCIIPSKIPTCRKGDASHIDTLLDWNTIHRKMPWGIVFLIGGGFSLAKASMASGLSAWIGEGLKVMADWPGWVMVFVMCLITAFLTEITSNAATCTILMPIVGNLAESVGYNPLYLMMPVALATSFAFMLPVATPSNAIAFSYGRLRIIDMVKGGFMLNFVCVGVVTMAVHTWVNVAFDLDVIPWAGNVTIAAGSGT